MLDPIIFGLMIGAFLFCTGLLIVIIKKNAIFVMIGIELMLNGANVNLVVFSGSDPNIQGQLMGIFDGSLTDKVASVLKKLGSQHAMIVYGDDGLDEISTTASTQISHLQQNGKIESMVITPSDYGFEQSTMSELKGGIPEVNAKIITAILDGSDSGKKADIVIMNAAAGIFVGGKADSMETCIELARESILSGTAKQKLDLLASVK